MIASPPASFRNDGEIALAAVVGNDAEIALAAVVGNDGEIASPPASARN